MSDVVLSPKTNVGIQARRGNNDNPREILRCSRSIPVYGGEVRDVSPETRRAGGDNEES